MNEIKEICGCGLCTEGYQHKSDCAVHNMPAMPNGECDCKPFRCAWCEDVKEDVVMRKDCDRYLCNDCIEQFYNGEGKTGYCSFECIMTGKCDGSC